MDLARILEFVGNHPVLFLAFFGTLGLLIASELTRRLSGTKSIGPVEATQLSNRENAIFLDVSDEAEYRAGHIPEAIHIPLKHLGERAAELRKCSDVPIISYCRSGNRSSRVGGILKKHGFENVYNLSGGLTAWQSANLPVSRK